MTIRSFAETITGDAGSATYQMNVRDKNTDSDLEPVTLTLTGSFAGATCTLYLATESASPMVWAPAPDGAFTEAGAYNAIMVRGCLFKFVTTGSGSPQSSISIGLRGDISAA